MGRYQVSIKIILLFYLLPSSILAADEITNLKETSIHKNMDEFFNFGTTATIEEIKAWDLDVSPDGTGLPKALEQLKKVKYCIPQSACFVMA